MISFLNKNKIILLLISIIFLIILIIFPPIFKLKNKTAEYKSMYIPNYKVNKLFIDLTDKTKQINKINTNKLGYQNLKVKTTYIFPYTKTFKVKVVDRERPIVKLNGLCKYQVIKGETFTDPGISAVDNYKNKVKIKTKNKINTNKEGKYYITYIVVDASKNKTIKKREVDVVKKTKENSPNPGTIFLTFDDGPRKGTTDQILDILKEENVKATFFVTGYGPDELIKREFDEGHTVGLHTYLHDYSKVYASFDDYFKDLDMIQDRVKKITGKEAKLIRFPGGSSNTISRRYDPGLMTNLTEQVTKRGYKYVDWNISSGDAGGTNDPNIIKENVINNLSMNKLNVVLMHDTNTHTKDALKNIIDEAKEKGYTFSRLTYNSPEIHHHINN